MRMSRRLTRESGLIEDVCEHGVGHPNAEWLRAHPEHDGTHGCDGCCSKETGMSKTQHTPGPWRAVELSHGHMDPPIRADDGDGRTVARVTGSCDGPTLVANARLIAAAPKLLAALELLTAHFSAWRNNEELVVMRNARAAIAETKGD